MENEKRQANEDFAFWRQKPENDENAFLVQIAAALLTTGQYTAQSIASARLAVQTFLAAMPQDVMITPAILRQAITDALPLAIPHAARVMAFQRLATFHAPKHNPWHAPGEAEGPRKAPIASQVAMQVAQEAAAMGAPPATVGAFLAKWGDAFAANTAMGLFLADCRRLGVEPCTNPACELTQPHAHLPLMDVGKGPQAAVLVPEGLAEVEKEL